MESVNNWTREWAEKKQIRVRYLRETTSTNDVAKEEFPRDQSVPLSLYLTDHQTHGKGRSGRPWLDTGGGGYLLSSWSYKVEKSPQPILTALVGLGIFKACRETWPHLAWSLKAPNDIYLESKKVAGILIESVQQGDYIRAVIGFGLDVTSHPEDVPEAADLQTFLEIEKIYPELWYQFCDSLHWQFQQALAEGVLPFLTDKLCAELLDALNRNPLPDQNYDEVLKDGSLRTGKHIRHWFEI